MAKSNPSQAPKNRSKKRTAGSKAGASQSKMGRREVFRAWLLHHQISAVESLIRLLSSPVQSIMTWAVIAVALILPSALYVGLENAKQFGGSVENTGQMSVFIKERARDLDVEALRERLLTKPEISLITLISAEQALEEFQARSGFGDILESLDSNPLPVVLVVQPSLVAANPEALSALKQAIEAERIVASVSVDLQWLERLKQIMAFAQRMVLALALLLVLGVILVVGNTIRLAIENRRDEIVVVKLVGGTNAFVRRPFLYTGIWYGLGGGVIAALALALGIAWLKGPISALSELYQGNFELTGLDWNASVFMILGAAMVGLLGAWLALGRHLGQIEPK